MATLKEARINEKWAKRPKNNEIIAGNVYFNVAEDEEYDLIKFSINEIEGYYWWESLCFPSGTPIKEINKQTEEYVKNISQEKVNEYKRFLEDGMRYGWD